MTSGYVPSNDQDKIPGNRFLKGDMIPDDRERNHSVAPDPANKKYYSPEMRISLTAPDQWNYGDATNYKDDEDYTMRKQGGGRWPRESRRSEYRSMDWSAPRGSQYGVPH